MDWFLLTLLCGAVSSTLILCYRLISPETNPFLFVGIATGIAFVLLAGYNLVMGVSLALSGYILIASILAGLVMTILDSAFVIMFRLGAPVSLAVPIFRVCCVVLAVFAGVLIFKETLTPLKILGILCACVALYLLNKKSKVTT